MITVDAFLDALQLEETGTDRYRAANVKGVGHGVVFGGQLLAQSIAAAQLGLEGMAVKTLHTVFARGASPDAPVDIVVDRMHGGRSFASRTVTISQGDRLCTRAVVLLSADEPDLIRHADPAPSVPAADVTAATAESSGDWEIRIVEGVDISDPDAVGPADLDVWTRFTNAPPDDPMVNQALVAFATDGFLIGTAMRPHSGIGQSMAHVSLATGVISHTITFHEPCRAGEWFLLSHHSPYAGRGRSYGRADIFQGDDLVASFVQDAMIRSMGPGRDIKA